MQAKTMYRNPRPVVINIFRERLHPVQSEMLIKAAARDFIL
jgi:hypothetical protein